MSVSLIREEDDLTEWWKHFLICYQFREKIHTSYGVILHCTQHEAVKCLNNMGKMTPVSCRDTMQCSHLHGTVMKGYCFIYKISNELKNNGVIIDVKLLYQNDLCSLYQLKLFLNEALGVHIHCLLSNFKRHLKYLRAEN